MESAKSTNSVKNQEPSKKAESIKQSSKKADSVKSSVKKPEKNEVHTFQTASFKNTAPVIKEQKLQEVELDDVLFYKEHESEYSVKKGEKLIPYIIRMNERYKKKVQVRQRNKKVKNGLAIFVFIFGLIISVVAVMYLISYLRSKKG